MDASVSKRLLTEFGVSNPVQTSSANDAVRRLQVRWDERVSAMKKALTEVNNDGSAPLGMEQNYPVVLMDVPESSIPQEYTRGFGACSQAGLYASTITHPNDFGPYLQQQLGMLEKNHSCPFVIGDSSVGIPFQYALRPEEIPADVESLLPPVDIMNIPEINQTQFGELPFSVFDGIATGYRMERLRHYTATEPTDFQNFVLLTNYRQYMIEFQQYWEQMSADEREKKGYIDFVAPITRSNGMTAPQMPALHLKRKDGNGITLVNIGVGPSNAHNFMDNLCAIRPHLAMMIGHSAGLRRWQKKGTLVLGDSFIRLDRIMDELLPTDIPICGLAEPTTALIKAVEKIHGVRRGTQGFRNLLQTGPVATHCLRPWEVIKNCRERVQVSRALALDMESATVAATAWMHHIPYAVLLCVSDLPLHKQPKLSGQAQSFYQQITKSHLMVGIEACESLVKDPRILHSRKLRGYDAVPFR